MAGLILYSVNPRSLGALPEWTAALMEAERLGCNAVHLNSFHPVSDSLYAIRDHFTLNSEFCSGADQAATWYQLRDFIKMANAKKIRTFVDLVLDSLAADHPLTVSHPQFFKLEKKRAKIDYENAQAWEYFLGEGGYWLRLLDTYLELGFGGFHCHAVLSVPQLVWERALNYALMRLPDRLIVADTLGLSPQNAELMRETLRESDGRIIYDLCYDDIARAWDCRDIPALKAQRKGRMDIAAHDGSMGFVDRIDLEPRVARLRAEYGKGKEADAKIAAQCLRDYAVACFTNDSVMIQRGYQWCMENNAGLLRSQVSAEFFKTLKQQRKSAANVLTLGPAIAEMHRLRSQLPRRLTVDFSHLQIAGHEDLTAMQCDYTPTGGKIPCASIILLLNPAPAKGPVNFPESWWLDFKSAESNAQRYQFGADRTQREQVSGVALLMVPGGLSMQRHHNPANVAALRRIIVIVPCWMIALRSFR